MTYYAEFRKGVKDGVVLAVPGELTKADHRFRFKVLDSVTFVKTQLHAGKEVGEATVVPTKIVDYVLVGVIEPLGTAFYMYKESK